ncbi:ANTAR domain-containing response regulator [Thermincola potens]|uniref:Stage 0 sporulation protein A homolog n=1 Tax=Thermincola potens (strain JR) TaxID=635013 RepID=D5XBY1_THEPJ|nr:ANTAR domain-containing protein [Thermincola potens]ADG81529.1 response regulator receiver and ANTAR domain protein [Thermincola potens JR]
MHELRIMIADPDVDFCKYLREKLVQAGYIVVAEASEARSALHMIFSSQPDVALINARFHGQDGLDISYFLEEHRIAPVILMADYDDYEILSYVLGHWVFGYLVKPIDFATLIPNMEIAVANYRRLLNLEAENKKLKENLENRKLIEKAKGILADMLGFTEEEALKFLQKISMDKCMPMKKVALKIIAKYGQAKNGRE